MDMEQEEMQFLGIFGIYKEAYKLIFRLRKIFTLITLALILPLSFIFFAHQSIYETLDSRMWHTEFTLRETKSGTPEYHELSDLLLSEWAEYILFKTIYFAFVLAFSLLSTSAIVYTVACIYSSREMTFKEVMSVVPMVWKRLIITFIWAFFAFCAYNTVFGTLTLYIWDASNNSESIVVAVFFVIVLIFYALGFVYLTIIWLLASVVSVLEEEYGIKAMIKSQGLIKGKMFVAIAIFIKLNLSLVIINRVFRVYVIFGYYYRNVGIFRVLGYGALCLLLLLKVILFGLVVQTVIYFVCKSYHHENIDKSALSDHLEVYLGDYVPLKDKGVQMEEYRA